MPRPASAPQIAADTPPAKPSIFAAIFEKLFGKPAPVKLAYAATDDGGLGVGQMGAARYDRWAVVAVRDATLSFVSRAAFGDFAKKHPELCQSLLRLLAKRVRERDKMAATSFPSLKGRIAQTLLELAEDFGQEVGPGRIVIRQKIRQTDLAAMAGVARETVTRILNDWQRHKLVSRLSGYYCLENEALLERQVKH
jgi:CRP-like cAMP-binding protein